MTFEKKNQEVREGATTLEKNIPKNRNCKLGGGKIPEMSRREKAKKPVWLENRER